jgi:hypothetical protein
MLEYIKGEIKMITLIDINTNEQVTMTLQEVIDDINRDRSEEWQNYDEGDWKEGLQHFTQWRIIEVTKGQLIKDFAIDNKLQCNNIRLNKGE